MTDTNKREMCVPCAESLKDGYTVKTVEHRANYKGKCEMCKKQRYIDTYEVASKRRGKENV